MLAFHCTAVSTLLSPAVTAGCGCPDANPSVLPGDQCPQQQPGGKDCITHGLLLPGPTVRGFQTGATVIGQRHLHRSGGSHRPQVCKHWKSVPGLSKVKSSPLPGLQKCSESKLFIFSSCGACDQRPPAKKSWFVGCECRGCGIISSSTHCHSRSGGPRGGPESHTGQSHCTNCQRIRLVVGHRGHQPALELV